MNDNQGEAMRPVEAGMTRVRKPNPGPGGIPYKDIPSGFYDPSVHTLYIEDQTEQPGSGDDTTENLRAQLVKAEASRITAAEALRAPALAENTKGNALGAYDPAPLTPPIPFVTDPAWGEDNLPAPGLEPTA